MLNLGIGRKAFGKSAYDAPTLLKRLFMEQALVHWRMYAVALVFMAISAGATALSAYVLGDVINQAYINRNMTAITWLSLGIVVLFAIKGGATYVHQVLLSRIGIGIVATNQRRMYDKLLNEGLSFFATRHSSEFIARMTSGATSAAAIVNIIVSALGRDLLSLIGLATVMVMQDPVLSLVSIVIVPPTLLFMRKLVKRLRGVATLQFKIYTDTIETMQETVQGIAVVKAFTLEPHLKEKLGDTVARYEHEAFKQARLANRSGPRDGVARWHRDCARADVLRPARHRRRRISRRVFLLHGGIPAGL